MENSKSKNNTIQNSEIKETQFMNKFSTSYSREEDDNRLSNESHNHFIFHPSQSLDDLQLLQSNQSSQSKSIPTTNEITNSHSHRLINFDFWDKSHIHGTIPYRVVMRNGQPVVYGNERLYNPTKSICHSISSQNNGYCYSQKDLSCQGFVNFVNP